MMEEEDKLEQDTGGEGHPPDEAPSEMDDDAIVEAIRFPKLQANPIRWVAALVIIAAIVWGIRAVSNIWGLGPEEAATTEEGLSYTRGDIVSQPFDAKEPLRVNFDEGQYVELSPGANISIGSPYEDESGRITLLNGRIAYTGPMLTRKMMVDAGFADVGISGGRLFIELWGGKVNGRLRVGVLSGSAMIMARAGGALSLVEGDAVLIEPGMPPQYYVHPINTRPPIDPRLEGWVFPILTQQDNPTVGGLIADVCSQVGLRVSIPYWARFAAIPAGDIGSYGDVCRLGELLEELSLQWGFEIGVDGDVLIITPLDEARHLGAIGEWVLLSRAKPEMLFWPRLFTDSVGSGARYRFDDVALLSAAPYEQRIGALAVLIGNRRKGGGEYAAETVDAELGLAFDITQPYMLRRLAFEDMYANPDIPLEKVFGELKAARVESARDYYRLRIWGPPAWGTLGIWSVYEPSLAEKLKDDESTAGMLYKGLATGDIDYKTATGYADQAYITADTNLPWEVARYFYDLAYDTPADVDPEIVSMGLKNIFDTGKPGLLMLAFDALRVFSKRLDADNTVLMLINPYTTDVNEELSRYAAAAMGTILRDHPLDDQERHEEALSRWTDEITDIDSKHGESTLFLLGLTKGLETEPCFVDATLVGAVETRLDNLPGVSPERLLLLRHIRAQRQALEGSRGLAWAYGIAGDKIAGIFSDNDGDFIVEAILSLGLDEPASSGASPEPDGLRTTLDNSFISLAMHHDPRLRWLSLNYILLNNPPYGAKALEKLAGDEYPAIGRKARGEM